MFWKIYNALCAQEGLSANAIAKKLNISSGTLTKWKNGTIPQNATLKKIAQYFNVSVEYLKGEEEAPKSYSITEQEKILLDSFRSTTELGRQKIIQSVLNICDEIEKNNSRKDQSNAG